MAHCLANYFYDFDGWTWEYLLFLDRLEAHGRSGPESAVQVYELVQYSDYPQRSSYVLPTPRRSAAIGVGILTGLLSLAGIIAVLVIEQPINADAVKALLLLGALLTAGLYQVTLKATARKDRVNRAEFRRLDATEQFVIWEINDAQVEAFVTFIRKVQAVIQSSRPASAQSN